MTETADEERLQISEPGTRDHESSPGEELAVLDYLKHFISDTLQPGQRTHLRYPTAISELLGFTILSIGEGTATLTTVADVDRHGNQQGTIHGGFLTELADAAIGTACSTTIQTGESFTSMNLNATFLRPAWSGELIAEAYPTHVGRTVVHYECQVRRASDGKKVMTAASSVMILRGDKAVGR